MPNQNSIANLSNLGPKSQMVLASVGIASAEELRRLGSIAAYVKAKRGGAKVSLNLLWALEGALRDVHWRVVARDYRTALLLALDDYERHF